MRLGEAEPVNRDGQTSGMVEGDSVRLSSEHLHAFRKGQLLCYFGKRVVISTDDEDFDAGLVQSADLLRQKSSGLHRCLFAVVEVAREDQPVYALGKTKIDDVDESTARGIANQFGQLRTAEREREGESRGECLQRE